MERKQCPYGHFYDSVRHASCPFCAELQRSAQRQEAPAVEQTMPIDGPAIPQKQPEAQDRTIVLGLDKDFDPGKDGEAFDPIVGWLVCVGGNEKNRGRDYHIRSHNNRMGRDASMNIVITDDASVSREDHAILSYDPLDRSFHLTYGKGRAIVRVNGESVYDSVRLAPYDRILLGRTELMFVPLSGEKFDWEWSIDE